MFYFVPNAHLFWHKYVPHTTGVTKQRFQCKSLDYLPCSPSLSSYIYNIYLDPVKEALAKASFSSNKEVKELLQYDSCTPYFLKLYNDNKLPKCWKKCLNVIESYLEHYQEDSFCK